MAASLPAAFDLGGTHFTLALGEPSGRIVGAAKAAMRAHEGPEAALAARGPSLLVSKNP